MTWLLTLILAVVMYQIYNVAKALKEIRREDKELAAIKETVAAIEKQLREVAEALGANDGSEG